MTMATNYKKYLAERVLNEQEHVTYRALSRALKVHCNHAKRMLFDFHRLENAKKPKSVHATYVITGTPNEGELRPTNGNGMHSTDAEGDEIMPSSPFDPTQPDEVEDPVPVTAIMLVREEDLADVKSRLKTIFSIYIYSVEPTCPQDLNVLADLGYSLLEPQQEDPLEHGHRYGMIKNKNVKRRTALPAVSSPVAASAAPQAKAGFSQPATKDKSLPQEEPKPKTVAETMPKPTPRPSAKAQKQTAAAKGDLFSAFAKTKPKAKKEEEVPTPPAAESEDVIMDDDSEEEEREDLFLDTGTRKSNVKRETRKEREAKLKEMMEDDEEMPDAPDTPEIPPPDATSKAEETESPVDEAPPAAQPESGSAPKGRRKVRRQVMKKKVVRDNKGYLVTVNEPVWEETSEDEPEPPKRKPAVSVAAKKAAAPAKGQGNIMSFFGKKP